MCASINFFLRKVDFSSDPFPKNLQNYAKRLQSGPKWAQNAPQKPLPPPYNPIQCLFQAFPRHEYPSGTLRGPSKATQYPSGPLLHAAGGPKSLGRAKKGPQGLFWPFQGNNYLIFSPQKGQNRPKWAKMLAKMLKTQSKGVKTGSKGVKTA